ncbi:MAG: molybdenum cofactor guanylyltransferase [Betaproteobacteria bacterium]|nr:molybdenum cofactor guanylyltransferase [Betaproteobacteria bacterium]
MSRRPEISAIVLAGGQARRMDGQDKGLIPLEGRPLIAWVLERLAPQADEIVVSANRHWDEYARFGHPVVGDASADYRGPLAGIHAAGQHAKGEWLLVAPCDTPFLPNDLAQRLLARARAEGARLACAADDAQVHPTTMLMHRDLLDSLGEYLARGQFKVRAWQAENGCAVARFTDDAHAFMNINSPDDLAAARRIAARV